MPLIQFGQLTGYYTRLTHVLWGIVCSHFFVVNPWKMLPLDIKSHVQFSDFKNDVKAYFLSLL